MCTAATYTGKDHYFGRNLDLELSYNESVTVTPRKFPLKFHQVHDMNEHFAIIGMATVVADYPLYYDATNEKGLSMAGLNFPGMQITRNLQKMSTMSHPLNSFLGFSDNARLLLTSVNCLQKLILRTLNSVNNSRRVHCTG